MKDTKGIGCGIWPILMKHTSALPACSWHDMAYMKHSWHQLNMSREDVDKQFFYQMLEIAGVSRVKRARAFLYYYLARAFGWLFWEGGE